MKKFLISLMVILSINCFASYDVQKNPIYHSILIVHKNINKHDAFKFSNHIAHYSKVYGLDPFLVVAISRHESYLNLAATRIQGRERIIYNSDTRKFTKTVRVTDFCMMQINEANVVWKKLDPERLITDPAYCIHEGLKILTYFKPISSQDPFWWTRYNSAKPEAREVYKQYILGHYKKIAYGIPNFNLVRKGYASSHVAYLAIGEKNNFKRISPQ